VLLASSCVVLRHRQLPVLWSSPFHRNRTMMSTAYINRIGTAVPPFDVHRKFADFASSILSRKETRKIFRRMTERGQIDHRFSFLQPALDETCFDTNGFYRRGKFPDTSVRMSFFERHAPALAAQALENIDLSSFKDEVTHLIVACCTGFYAPGLDIDIVKQFGLRSTVERTIVGFMGCYAAVSALKLARHIVRSQPGAKVIVVNIELCTIHLQEVDDLEQMLCFYIWGDGCSACLVSAEASGIELRDFQSTVIGQGADQMAWRIGLQGFDMALSGKVPQTLARALRGNIGSILGGSRVRDIDLWAIHPAGRSILDAVGSAIELDDEALSCSRDVLRRFGNMSSATITFVLKAMMDRKLGGLGCGMAFGPGRTAESMTFELESR
jgi:alpha-pyrone synthase